MAATEDILRSYRAPRAVVRSHLARKRSEMRVFSFLIAGLIVIFIAQWPRLSRFAFEHPDQPLTGLMVGTGLGLLAAIPLFYLMAAGAVLLSRGFGGAGNWYGGRLSLFWAMLAISPLMLLQGLVAGFIGAGPQLGIVSLLVFAVFFAIWIAGLRVTQFETEAV
ncbi:YIP1 family protein [Pseudothioclava arenosa]|uniref:YIP1 family protein n=1 Tax=Pseudothioclava arenosa TaxID=1795308 RepID=A0A2A4CRN0_9RHOB|nr:YIP1 family protein [Pseudothioclava arenosa]PCD76786.1 YIP1 family protein [Pseudothioclava arenosa]